MRRGHRIADRRRRLRVEMTRSTASRASSRRGSAGQTRRIPRNSGSSTPRFATWGRRDQYGPVRLCRRPCSWRSHHLESRGTIEGRLAPQPRGGRVQCDHDLLMPPPFGRTLAEALTGRPRSATEVRRFGRCERFSKPDPEFTTTKPRIKSQISLRALRSPRWPSSEDGRRWPAVFRRVADAQIGKVEQQVERVAPER